MLNFFKSKSEYGRLRYQEGVESKNQEIKDLQKLHESEIKNIRAMHASELKTQIDTMVATHAETVKNLQALLKDNNDTHERSIRTIQDQYSIKEISLNNKIKKLEVMLEQVQETDYVLKDYLREAKEISAKKVSDIQDIIQKLANVTNSLAEYKRLETKIENLRKNELNKVVSITRKIQ